MWVERAYEERERLSDRDLGGLRSDLTDQVLRYRDAIRGYSPEEMAKHGTPYLNRLLDKLAVVDALIASRSNSR